MALQETAPLGRGLASHDRLTAGSRQDSPRQQRPAVHSHSSGWLGDSCSAQAGRVAVLPTLLSDVGLRTVRISRCSASALAAPTFLGVRHPQCPQVKYPELAVPTLHSGICPGVMSPPGCAHPGRAGLGEARG